MKKPSLDAIRRLKEQQEQKKREQEEKKIQERLTTLEHRAAQGDKKAKSRLKQIEKAQEERTQNFGGARNEHHRYDPGQSSRNEKSKSSSKGGLPAVTSRKPKVVETNFEELLKLAKTNTNEVKRPEPPPPPPPKPKHIPRRPAEKPAIPVVPEKRSVPSIQVGKSRDPSAHPRVSQPAPKLVINGARPPQIPGRSNGHAVRPEASYRPAANLHTRPRPPPQPQLPIRRVYYRDEDEYDEDEDEDEYEADGFVVDEDDDEVQDELKKTIKSVFRYDKRRCDLREQELDRQYRAIGRVSTFEDLEREERRAARLAASEDARAQRDEEERKLQKKLRLKNMRG